MKKIAARISRCGCLMEWMTKGVVLVVPCGDDTCDAMAMPRPGRGRWPMVLRIPEEAQ